MARTQRRKSTWVGSADQGFIAVGGGASVINQSLALADGETVVRVRGVLSVKPSVYTADVDIVGAMGFALVSNQALAAGAASIPGPWTNNASDLWFVWMPFAFRFEVGATAEVSFPASVQLPIDSKAMRKGDAGETIAVMVESQAAALEASVAFRLLLKLP